jgi:hypothetical protein
LIRYLAALLRASKEMTARGHQRLQHSLASL